MCDCGGQSCSAILVFTKVIVEMVETDSHGDVQVKCEKDGKYQRRSELN